MKREYKKPDILTHSVDKDISLVMMTEGEGTLPVDPLPPPPAPPSSFEENPFDEGGFK
ncbi:hypothetical protein [Carboxylicivirga marina]|uniref:hypothetical protein n=1 Tax=Carboxylicivirga marina TaxID=2800988 RepID=UPI002595F0DF|nr:hypothetical protein [uncultured Carboxylicivirga sp.]